MSTAKLFEPITLRGLTVRNRIWVPPMCQFSVLNHDGIATDWHTAHYGGLARGGADAIIIEATGVVAEGRISPADLGLWNDEQAAALAPIVAFMHSQGAAVGIQLAHAGRKASTWSEIEPRGREVLDIADGGWPVVAPSAIPHAGLAMPLALDATGIRAVVDGFAAAARRAVTAGIDLIEIHGAHGYLLHEFLSPFCNQRTDKYGGPLENRARLLVEIVDAVRAAIGEDVPLAVRLSATEWVEGGFDLDEAIQVVSRLRDHGVDLADISTAGNVDADHIPVGPGYQVPLATAIKQATDVPVAAVGLITEPIQAEHILRTGQADIVLVGRAMLRYPHWPLHAAERLGTKLAYVPLQYRRSWRAVLLP